MSEIKKVKIQNFIETQIPEFLVEDNPIFTEFLKQYYISQEHSTGVVDLANNFIDYKKIDNFNFETFVNKTTPCILTQDVQAFSDVIRVTSTVGFPSTYGLLKIDDEIITYKVKTETTFEDCVRAFSGIDNVANMSLNFNSTQAQFHSKDTVVQNLNLLFFDEIFKKFKTQFLPGFENRELVKPLNLKLFLSRAIDLYSAKGTSTSYEILFKILFNEDISVVTPSDYLITPSNSSNYITKNILVEKISGDIDPLSLKGSTIFQNTASGLTNASIYNVEIRPISGKILYEISLDPESIQFNFTTTSKTNVVEAVGKTSLVLTVDSTVGFPQSGELIVQSPNQSLNPFTLSYSDKTSTQFLEIVNNITDVRVNDTVLSSNFAYCDVNGVQIYFRIINVIESVDYSLTSNLRVGDKIKLSSFGVSLNQYPQFNTWLYNLPTNHRIKSLFKISDSDLYRIETYDEIFVSQEEDIILSNPEYVDDVRITAEITSIINNKVIEVISTTNLIDKTTLSIKIKKANSSLYPSLNYLTCNIQNSYTDFDESNFYIASSGLPEYSINPTPRTIFFSTQVSENSLVGTTELNTNVPHFLYTGEKVYCNPNQTLGISTGSYYVTAFGPHDTSNKLSLSYSASDLIANKYIEISGSISGEISKIDYQNKELGHQKLLRKFPRTVENPSPNEFSDQTTGDRPIGVMLNGVEVYSTTLYDENIYYGKLEDIKILNPGKNYDVINTPSLQIEDIVDGVGYGTDAVARANLVGSVSAIRVVDSGFGYRDDIRVSIRGGGGKNALLSPTVIKTKTRSAFLGDGNGVNPTTNSITFISPHNFENGEVVEYIPNGNSEIEYSDPNSNSLIIKKLPKNSFYFVGVISNSSIKLYRTLSELSIGQNEINLTTSSSSGVHYFQSLNNKNTIVNIDVINPGEGYSSKSISIPSNLDDNESRNGINVYLDYIFAKNHNFNEKDLVEYSTTDTTISGVSTTNNYFLKIINKDKFKLCFAGTGSTVLDYDYNQGNYVRLNSVGVGTHTFSYPPIEVVVECYPETKTTGLVPPVLEPVILGSIESVFIENYGQKYGTPEVINFHRRPNISISKIKRIAILKPIIVDGAIIDIQILNYGSGYSNNIDLKIIGSGKYAELYPIIESGKIQSVRILNPGIEYDKFTKIEIVERGSDVKFQANVFEWKINQIEKNRQLLAGDEEGILVPGRTQQDKLQFVHFYPPKKLRYFLNDSITTQNTEALSLSESPIFGWAYDGSPIYGPYLAIEGQVKRVQSSYRKNIERNANLRPTTSNYVDGIFIQDYEFNPAYGDLDEYNGRFIQNAQFPNGVYAYFYTTTIDNSSVSIPQYPYLVASKFKFVPRLENYNPNYNQDLDLNTLKLIRHTSPYYLNSANSYYDAIDNIEDRYNQEFTVRSVSTSGIDSVSIYSPGDNYVPGDIVDFRNDGTGGSGATASVLSISGEPISSINIGITTFSNIIFEKLGSQISGILKYPIDVSSGETIVINSVSDPAYTFLLGNQKVVISQPNSVGISTNIANIGVTGSITEIFLNNISGMTVSDFIKIDEEVLKILRVIPETTSLIVERISNVAIHTAGISQARLLPRKFYFYHSGSKLVTTSNKTNYFNPSEDIATQEIGKAYNKIGITSFTIPEKSIYIPNHSYYTGQPLTYHSGISGTPLSVYNSPGQPTFQLQNNQTIYSVVVNNDFIGISTLGFTTTTGIGSTYRSLYFSSSVTGIGIAHSFTTKYDEISGSGESYSVTLETSSNHNLESEDTIKLSVVPEITKTIKFRYNPALKKITTDYITFNTAQISVSTSKITIDTANLNTGDKIVYSNNSESTVGGLQNDGEYFIVVTDLNKIQLANYYSDAIEGRFVILTSIGTGTQRISKLNPQINITKGNTLIFDLSDSSMSSFELGIYLDSNFKNELKTFLYTDNSGQNLLRTSTLELPRELYYKFSSPTEDVYEELEVVNGNYIQIIGSDYNNEYKIVKLSDKTLRFNLASKPEDVTYTLLNLSSLTYSTKSRNASGPINQIQLNYSGRGYKRIPRISNIISQSGASANLSVKSSKIGRISSVERIKDGFDYPTDTTLLPVLSVPAVAQIESISRVDYVGVLTGGKNYNTAPTLKILGNDKIQLKCNLRGTSISDVEIVQNTNDLSRPLKIISTRNSNGYGIDDIAINGNDITIEIINSNTQSYPLSPIGYGSTQTIFPFSIGDQIYIERCRITPIFDASDNLIPQDNYNSSEYNYRFFTVTGISSSNYTITYNVSGLKDGLALGEYTSDFGYGYVINRKDMPEFEMVLANDLSYISNENVFGYDESGTNTFSAKVMEGGWDNEINELRLVNCLGDLKPGYMLSGQQSLLNGIVVASNTFNLTTNLGVTRDKINYVGNTLGGLNDNLMRISDNQYYQKFSYAIRGKVPYNIWKEPVRSILHPSGFKEFSDLEVVSSPSNFRKPTSLPNLSLLVNIDNYSSTYTKHNFAMVTEEDQFEDGSIERIVFEEGTTLTPYILSKTNRVGTIDDISSQFNGTAILQVIATKPVTFISTSLYNLGVSTSGLLVGDKVGFSTYHFYPDSTYISTIANDSIGINTNSPHRLLVGIATQSLSFSRRVPGCKITGKSDFKLTDNGSPIFYREFDASNGINTAIDLNRSVFMLPNHNFQTGQLLNYTPEYSSIVAIASTTIGSGAILIPSFDENYSVKSIRVASGGIGYSTTTPPSIEIVGTVSPIAIGTFIPLIETSTGIITSIQIGVGASGYGYFPLYSGKIGIGTTSETTGRKDIVLGVGGGIGSAIYERGYNVAITTTLSGISSNVTPNFSGNQNRLWGATDPYLPMKSTSGIGIGAQFSVFIVYNSSTGQPISTSVVLRDGGRGYSVGNTVSISGTHIGGTTPTNDLTFTVSRVSNTRISLQANANYLNILGNSNVGYGTGARFNIFRDSLGNIGGVSVVSGGRNYSTQDNISIAGTLIGGISPNDNLFLSAIELGTDTLPEILYVNKVNKDEIKVSGVSTGSDLTLTQLGIGTHSFSVSNPNVNSLIAIDNIIQAPIYRKNRNLTLSSRVSVGDTTISLISGANTLILDDILSLDSEYIRIKNIGTYGPNTLLVERGFLGTGIEGHQIDTKVNVVSGDYNIIKDNIYFSSPPLGPSGLPGLEVNSAFSGRIFSRQFDAYTQNDNNIIFDDISDQFNGIAATAFVLKSNGNTVSGIYTNTNSIIGGSSGVDNDNSPIILINNIAQIGGVDYVIDTPGQNTIRFTSGTPLAGKISRVGYTTGFGYMPLVGASATVAVSGLGTLSNVYLTGFGAGYRSAPSISIASTVGTGASIVATIGTSGTITSLSIINPGSGYTNSILPQVRIDIPQNYYNMSLSYASGSSGQGQGAKASIIVGNGSSIISFELNSTGVGYSVGDNLVISGITTIPNTVNFSQFRVTVLETITDNFVGWYPGQFVQFDNISSSFNGIKKRFIISKTILGVTNVVSIRTNTNDIKIQNNLFVFINDILQVPDISYTYSAGRISFTEAPKSGSKCNILYFRGSDLDVEQVDPPKTIKTGDSVKITENIYDPFDVSQFERVVKDVVGTNIIDTFPYDSIGILTTSDKIRPLDWTKQTTDRILNGSIYSKSRPSLTSRTIPVANIIKDVSRNDTVLYVDSALPLFEDIDETRKLNEDLRDVIILDNREIIQPMVTSIVSTAGTIVSFDIVNPGSGYKNVISPKISVSAPNLIKFDPILNWSSNVGIVTSNQFNSVAFDKVWVSVGNSGEYAFSYNSTVWNSGRKINPDVDFNAIAVKNNQCVVVGNSALAYGCTSVTSNTSWNRIYLIKLIQTIGSPPTGSISTYQGNINSIIYDASRDVVVGSGNSGKIFIGSGISTDRLYEVGIGIENMVSTCSNSNYIISVGSLGTILYSDIGLIWDSVVNVPTNKNLNCVIWTGMNFVAVGDDGTVLTSDIGASSWTLIPTNIVSNILKIRYYNNLYTILDNSGKLYFSLDLRSWVSRVVDDSYSILDILPIDTSDNSGYISVGSSGFISYSTPQINKATANATATDGRLSSITVTNGGFGYNSTAPNIVETEYVDSEQIYSIKARGDYGNIVDVTVYPTGNVGFGTNSPAIEFKLSSRNYINTIPNMQYSPLIRGDYFIINNSNVICSHALTGITTSLGGMSNYPNSKIGTANTFIDGIYKAENVTTPTLGISTVRCSFVPNSSGNITINSGVNTIGFYGNYSFGIVYDYQNRSRKNPKAFVVNKDNGLIGLSSGPMMYRTRGLL